MSAQIVLNIEERDGRICTCIVRSLSATEAEERFSLAAKTALGAFIEEAQAAAGACGYLVQKL